MDSSVRTSRKIVSVTFGLLFIISAYSASGNALNPADASDRNKSGGGHPGGLPFGGLTGGGGNQSLPSPPSLPDPYVPVEIPEFPEENVTFSNDTVMPTLPTINFTYPTPPDPNLFVINLTSSEKKVKVNSSVIITAKAENLAYGYVNFTQIAFYEDSVNESGLIDVVNCSMDGWEGFSQVEWSSSVLGNHTIIAIVDPHNRTRELDEHDNLNATVVEVVSYDPPQLPDLAVYPEEILPDDVAFQGIPVQVEIIVHNEGNVAVNANISVLVKEMPSNTTVDSYNISGLSGDSFDSHNSTWNASTSGKNYLHVYVDPDNEIEEEEEDDNIGRNGFEVVVGPKLPIIPDPNQNLSLVDCNKTIVFGGDVHVGNGYTWLISNCAILINGNLTVAGSLRVVDQSKIVLNSTDVTRALTIFSGGALEFDCSVMTVSTWSRGFVFVAENGSQVALLNDTTVRWTTGSESYPLPSGIQLYTSSVTIDDAIIEEGRGHGLYIANNVDISNIGNSTVRQNGLAGAYVKESNAWFWNMGFENNHDGLRFLNSTGIVDSGTIADTCRYGVFINNSFPAISRNDIHSGGVCLRDLVEEGPQSSPPVGVVFPWRSKHPAIYNVNSSPTVTGNTVRGFRTGIQIDGTSMSNITGNTIENNSRAGIILNLSGDSVFIGDSNSISNHTDGIGLEAIHSSPRVSYNSFRWNQEGIRGEHTSLNASDGNSFLDNDFGVTLVNSSWISFSDWPSVFNNTFGRTPNEDDLNRTHVHVENSTAYVASNTFEDDNRPDNTDFALVIANSSASLVTGNDVIGQRYTNGTGIYIHSSQNQTISHNYVSDYVGNTVLALKAEHDSSINLSNNTFSESIHNVFLMRNISGVVSNNLIETTLPEGDRPPGGEGIYVTYSDNLMIKSNTIRNFSHSIDLHASSLTVEDNNISSRLYDHVNKTVMTNSHADTCGICVYEGSSPIISGNTITGHGYGVSIESGTTGDLMYATLDGSVWVTETIDSKEYVGRFTSIDLDRGGEPHIAYFKDTGADLKLASKHDSSWTTQTVDSVDDVGCYASLVLDRRDYPHIGHYNLTSRTLRYSEWNGTSWESVTVDSNGSVGEYTSLALENMTSYPHMSYYYRVNVTHGHLKHANWTESGWNTEIVDNATRVGLYTSIALDSIGYPHIAYYDWNGQKLKYANWTGSEWHSETVDNSPGMVGWYTSIALDAYDIPHISYYDKGYFNNVRGDLKYATLNGSEWNLTIVDSEGDVGWYTSIALDNDGYPHISYYDRTLYDLKYTWFNGSTWQNQTVDSYGKVGSFTSLALNSSGIPHISYYNETELPSNPTIIDNDISRTGWISIASGGIQLKPDVNNPQIVGNRISHSVGGGIKVGTYNWANITDNYVNYTHGNVSTPEGSEHFAAIEAKGSSERSRGQVNITNNTIFKGTNAGTNGIRIWDWPDHWVNVENNTITDFFRGILTGKRYKHNVTDNHISDSERCVEIHSGGRPKLQGNSMTNCTRGILFQKGAAWVEGRWLEYKLNLSNAIVDSDYGIYFGNSHHVTLENISWIRNTTYPIFSVNSSPIIRNVSVSGGDHGIVIISNANVSGADYVSIENVSTTRNEYNGLVIDASKVHVVGLNSSLNGLDGLLIYGGDSTVDVRGNSTFWRNDNGVRIHTYSSIRVHDSDIVSNDIGVYSDLSSPTITSNRFVNNNVSVYAFRKSSPAVEGNSITYSESHTGLRYGMAAWDCYSLSKNMTLTHNWMNYTEVAIGVWSSGTQGSSVDIHENNVSFSQSGYAVVLKHSEAVMNGSKEYALWEIEGDGIGMENNSFVRIRRVNITISNSSEPQAVRIFSTAGSHVITDGNMEVRNATSVSGSLVDIDGDNVTFSGNTVENVNPGNNLLVRGGASIKILENHVIGNTSSQEGGNIGIHVTGGEVNISDNMEISGKDSAVLIEGSSTTVQMRNTTVFGALKGVSVSSTATDVEISHGNEIYDNTYGIHIQGGNASVHHYNEIHDNEYGIYMNTSYGPRVWHNNTIHNNTEAGVWISTNVVIYDRQVWWNDIIDNGVGMEIEDDPPGSDYYHCECNWWGDSTGPYEPSPEDPDQNLEGEGQYVKDYFYYRDPGDNDPYWLRLPGLQATNCSAPG